MTDPATPDTVALEAKENELLLVCQRMRERGAASAADYVERRRLFEELLALGRRKADLARLAGVSPMAINFALKDK